MKKRRFLPYAIMAMTLIACASKNTKEAKQPLGVSLHAVPQESESQPLQTHFEPFVEGGETVGLTITGIEKGSVWDQAGLQEGDVIVKLYQSRLSSKTGQADLVKAVQDPLTADIEVLRKEGEDGESQSVRLRGQHS